MDDTVVEVLGGPFDGSLVRVDPDAEVVLLEDAPCREVRVLAILNGHAEGRRRRYYSDWNCPLEVVEDDGAQG